MTLQYLVLVTCAESYSIMGLAGIDSDNERIREGTAEIDFVAQEHNVR
jgi:hypothetical protein